MEKEDSTVRELATTRYIGDGVYASMEDGRLKLDTRAGINPNVIYLEADVLCNLFSFLELEVRHIPRKEFSHG